jgi:hypothetical protein
MGNLKVFKWFGSNNNHYSHSKAFIICCKHGRLDIARYLEENNGFNDVIAEKALFASVKNGNFDIVKYLFEQHSFDDKSLFRALKIVTDKRNLNIYIYISI